LTLVVIAYSDSCGRYIPVFAQAREKARQTACLSNMRQMGMAAQMYTQIRRIAATCGDSTATGFFDWHHLVRSLRKKPQVWIFPSANAAHP